MPRTRTAFATPAAPSLAALSLAVLLAAAAFAPPAAAQPNADQVLDWPEAQRAFFQDGAAWLLGDERRAELAASSEPQRQAAIDGFLADDPIPETPENELTVGIERRRELVMQEIGTFEDARAKLLFLHGRPAERAVIDCGSVFKPVEIWRYRSEADAEDVDLDDPPKVTTKSSGTTQTDTTWSTYVSYGLLDGNPVIENAATWIVVYKPRPDEAYRVWEPLDAKRDLYSPEMEYLMEQYEELRRLITGRSPDRQLCPDTKLIERATGIRRLTDYARQRPRREHYFAWLLPPADLASWAERAAATELPESPPELAVADVGVYFLRRNGQRLTSQIHVNLPPGAGYESAPAEVSGKAQLRLLVAGVIEQSGRPFDDFRVRFRPPPPAAGAPLALVFERDFRPGFAYLVRLTVEDEVGEARERRTFVVRVPLSPRPEELPQPPPGTEVATGEDVKRPPIAGEDNLVLLPPPGETVIGLWRATALVSGERIERVVFSVDGSAQLTSRNRPYSAELRLAKFPVEQVVRAEGYDAEDNLVASDEIVINRPRAAFRVRVSEPPEGAEVVGRVAVKADVSVPEEKRLERVEFILNDEPVATLEQPPWEVEVTVPSRNELAYLTVAAYLADGTRTEAVRVLNAGPGFSEQLEVNLVELYVAAQGPGGELVRGLAAADFVVKEEGRSQQIRKFELVDNLPLTVGIVIDTSGSMSASLSEAQRAAIEFLSRVSDPGDRAFAVAFSDVPTLLMPPTDDVDAVAEALAGLRAAGWTVLHDAVITALSYLRDVEGQQALVLLSDGDDSASNFPWKDALEYARRSEAAIYTIGLNVPVTSLSVRGKLQRLARDTGGRAFFISKAEELEGVYAQIEEELRSRYLVAYAPEPTPEPGSGYRRVDVEVKRSGIQTRTQQGYYP